MWNRTRVWGQRTLREIVDASVKFKTGKEYLFLLHEVPIPQEMEEFSLQIKRRRPDISVGLERNGLMLTCRTEHNPLHS